MTTLSIRDLPDDVHARLRARASVHGRSLEAEALEILTAACTVAPTKADPADLQAFVDTLYGTRKPSGVADDLIAERRREADRAWASLDVGVVVETIR